MLHRSLILVLFILLVCHTMAWVLVSVGSWWQAEHDLSEQLLVHHSVDSIVEFQFPLSHTSDGTNIARTTEDGFSYRGHYYSVVSLEILQDTLHIAGLELPSHSFWQSDLLAFLHDHLNTSSNTDHKASQLLKLLLKEYAPNVRLTLQFLRWFWRESNQIPDGRFILPTRSVPIHCPPPQRLA